MDTTDHLLSVAEVARELGLTTRAIQHRITTGTLTAHRVGNQYVITRAELDDAIDRAKAKTA
jgi:excisionase family DNA binding protein